MKRVNIKDDDDELAGWDMAIKSSREKRARDRERDQDNLVMGAIGFGLSNTPITDSIASNISSIQTPSLKKQRNKNENDTSKSDSSTPFTMPTLTPSTFKYNPSSDLPKPRKLFGRENPTGGKYKKSKKAKKSKKSKKSKRSKKTRKHHRK